MMPTNVAARMTLAADPESLQGAVAAGILGAGPVVLGTSEECARLLEDAPRSRSRPASEIAREIHAAGGKVPGFGHPVHTAARPARRADPRARRRARRERRRTSRWRAASATRSPRSWGKPLTMNVSMPIAAVLLDLGFPAAAVKAVPILARTAGLLAHLAEEQQQPVGFLLAREGRGGGRVRARVMLEPEVETRRGHEQLALDDASYRAQLAYSSSARRSTARS